jgi:hypothetical protein
MAAFGNWEVVSLVNEPSVTLVAGNTGWLSLVFEGLVHKTIKRPELDQTTSAFAQKTCGPFYKLVQACTCLYMLVKALKA